MIDLLAIDTVHNYYKNNFLKLQYKQYIGFKFITFLSCQKETSQKIPLELWWIRGIPPTKVELFLQIPEITNLTMNVFRHFPGFRFSRSAKSQERVILLAIQSLSLMVIYQAHGLLSPNLNHLINDGIIHENCIITVNEYFAHASTQFGATIIIILDCDVVESHQHRIGNPLPIYWYRPWPSIWRIVQRNFIT